MDLVQEGHIHASDLLVNKSNGFSKLAPVFACTLNLVF